jgi:hypothetical protein
MRTDITPLQYALIPCNLGKERKWNKNSESKCIQMLPISKVLFKPLTQKQLFKIPFQHNMNYIRFLFPRNRRLLGKKKDEQEKRFTRDSSSWYVHYTDKINTWFQLFLLLCTSTPTTTTVTTPTTSTNITVTTTTTTTTTNYYYYYCCYCYYMITSLF